MAMETRWEMYREIAAALAAKDMESALLKMENRIQKDQYIVPFIGQFSAGKSKLINGVLTRDLLPVKPTESTSYPTFLSYGDEERVIVQYDDDSQDKQSLACLQEIYQNAATQAWTRGKTIRRLLAYLPEPLLRDGLVLVDTPGLNTVYQGHVWLTEDLLPTADYVFYVFAKPLTQTDCKIIEHLRRLGQEIAFVRTKMDLLQEDCPADVMKKDRECLRALFPEGERISYFALSGAASAEQGLETLLLYLRDTLATQVKQRIDRAIKRKQNLIAQELRKRVHQELERVAQDGEKDKETLTAELQRIRLLQDEVQGERGQLVSQIMFAHAKEKRGVCDKLLDAAEKQRRIFDNAMACLPDDAQLEQAAAQLQSDAETELLEEMKRVAQSDFAAFLRRLHVSCEKLAAFEPEPQDGVDSGARQELRVETLEWSHDYVQACLAQRRQCLNEITSFLKLKEEELREIGLQREELAAAQQELQATAQAAEQDLNAMDPYQPAWIEEESTEYRALFRQIGSLADFALMFVPGGGAGAAGAKGAQAIATAGNAAQNMQKAAKAIKTIEVLNKVGKVAQQAAKVGKNLAKARDTLESAGQKLPKEKRDTLMHILDYMTLEHWFGEAGGMLDEPPRVYEDPAVREEYARQRALLYEKYEQMKFAELEKARELKLLQTREAQEQREKQLQRLYATRLAQEIADMEGRLKQEGREKAVKEYKTTRKKCFGDFCDSLFARFVQRYMAYLDQSIADVIVCQTAVLDEKLEKQAREMQALLEEQAGHGETLAARIAIWRRYLAFLEEESACNS